MGCYSSRRHVFWCICTFSVVLQCVTAVWVRHGLHMFCHSTVLYKLDGDVSQTRAVTDSSILFTFLHYITWFFTLRALPWCLGGAATLLWLLAPFSPHLC